MLKTLFVKNYALLDEIRVEFQKGLNVITGETGAGKSILIGALSAVLGEKIGKDAIRSGADRAIVEAEFEVSNTSELLELLKSNDCDVNDQILLLRREVSSAGRSRCFVNDTPVSQEQLIAVGNLLIDLHGQHDHQLLFQVNRHIQYLDAFAGLDELLKQVQLSFHALAHLERELEELLRRAGAIKQSRDMYQFQLSEINAISPVMDEDEELKKEELILRNAELLNERTAVLYQVLYEREGAVAELLKNASENLVDLQRIDTRFSEQVREIEQARLIIEEVATFVQRYNIEITFDSDRLEKIRQRLAALTGLMKKYNGTIAAVLQYRAKLENELSVIDNLDDAMEDLRTKIEKERNLLTKLCLELSQKRIQIAAKLEPKVTAELANLGMSKSKFAVSQWYKDATKSPFIEHDGHRIHVSHNGIDQIEFVISANPGEPLKPLVNIASGGEISRIMLALKSLLAEVDQVPVLIFDEIDLGISGRIAQSVAKTLRSLARTHQVICITHLPQIASMAQHQYLVEKSGDDRVTRSSIRILSEEERVEQIAVLFGGENVTSAHLQSARELIQEANQLAL